MITSDAGFIIATPTKCGTTTLESVARRHMRQYPADHDDFRVMDWDRPRRQHRMALPPAVNGHEDIETEHEGEPIIRAVPGDDNEWGRAGRFLLVRNPYTRYLSMYTYLSAPANYSQWGAREIQGRAWGGAKEEKVFDQDPMTFDDFLFWLAAKRRDGSTEFAAKQRGSFFDGRAYRSPWVWTDSLTDSLTLLSEQPGGASSEDVGLIRLENLWNDLFVVLKDALVEVDLSPLHSNRSTAYGELGAEPGGRQFWGGIECSIDVFKSGRGGRGVRGVRGGKREFSGEDVPGVRDQCGECAACVIGVAREARVLGYA